MKQKHPLERWYTLFAGYFFKLQNEEVRSWERELTARIKPTPTPVELVRAVRKLTLLTDGRGGHLNRPTLVHMENAIRELRNTARGGVPGYKKDLGCQYCTDGWTNYTRQHGASKGSELAIPCVCERGEEHLQSNFVVKDMLKMRELAKVALIQIKDRNRAAVNSVLAPTEG